MPRVHEIVEPSGAVVRRAPRLGDLRWDGTVWRRWSGRRWLTAAYSLHPERLDVPERFDLYPPVAPEARTRALARAVEDQVATKAASVVFDGPSGVVLGYKRPISHIFHAVMTLLTGGLWALVWLALVLGRSEDRIQLEIDRWGNVWARQVAAA